METIDPEQPDPVAVLPAATTANNEPFVVHEQVKKPLLDRIRATGDSAVKKEIDNFDPHVRDKITWGEREGLINRVKRTFGGGKEIKKLAGKKYLVERETTTSEELVGRLRQDKSANRQVLKALKIEVDKAHSAVKKVVDGYNEYFDEIMSRDFHTYRIQNNEELWKDSGIRTFYKVARRAIQREYAENKKSEPVYSELFGIKEKSKDLDFLKKSIDDALAGKAVDEQKIWVEITEKDPKKRADLLKGETSRKVPLEDGKVRHEIQVPKVHESRKHLARLREALETFVDHDSNKMDKDLQLIKKVAETAADEMRKMLKEAFTPDSKDAKSSEAHRTLIAYVHPDNFELREKLRQRRKNPDAPLEPSR